MNNASTTAMVLPINSQRTALNDGSMHMPAGEPFPRNMNNAPDMMYTVDIDGIINYVNGRAAALTGYQEHELIGMRYLELVAPMYRTHVQNFYIEQIIDEFEVTSLEFPLVAKDGKQIWVCQNTKFILEASDPGFIASVRDIADKHDAEEELRRAKEHARNIFEHAVQGMFRYTGDGKIVVVNSAYLKLLGYHSPEELKEKKLIELYVNRRSREQVNDILEACGSCYNVEFQLRRKDGKIITVLEHSRAIRNEWGDVTMYEGILEDITLKRANEAAMQIAESALKDSHQKIVRMSAHQDKMFAHLSNDLRPSLRSLLGFCDLLLAEPSSIAPDKRLELMRTIREMTQHQLKSINTILE